MLGFLPYLTGNQVNDGTKWINTTNESSLSETRSNFLHFGYKVLLINISGYEEESVCVCVCVRYSKSKRIIPICVWLLAVGCWLP